MMSLMKIKKAYNDQGGSMREKQVITLKSETGFTAEILTLGGIILKIMAMDKSNCRKNVVLGYDSIDDYNSNNLFLGCIIGPIAGRTEKGLVKIGDISMQLDTSCHPNSLHSCSEGLHLVNWKIKSQNTSSLVLSHQSQVNNCKVDYEITYSVTGETLTIKYFATTSSPVYLSLTNHSYFNLSGNPDRQIIQHMLKLNCTHYAKLDEDNLPTKLVPMENTQLDFTESRKIHEVLEDSCEDVDMASGIDHPFKCGDSKTVAELYDRVSGILLQVLTTQPYVVVYTGNFLASATSPSGKTFGKHTGICFETQDLPNVAGNKLDDVKLVTPDSPYSRITSFAFSTLG
jgi:aldose 1-epimerase